MNPIAINIIIAVSAIILGYLIGSIPTGVIIGKAFFHQDVRELGSKNSGGTNVARTFGKKFGILVIALDMIKSIIPVFTIWAICTFIPEVVDAMNWAVPVGLVTIGGAKTYYWMAGFFAAVGHCWPVFIHFKGGKAVAVFMGLNCLTSWLQFICCGFTYLILAKKTNYISLTSIIVSGIGALIGWILFSLSTFVPFNFDIFLWSFGATPFLTYGLEFALMVTGVTLLLVFRHASNIRRLKEGTEGKNPFNSPAKN